MVLGLLYKSAVLLSGTACLLSGIDFAGIVLNSSYIETDHCLELFLKNNNSKQNLIKNCTVKKI